MRVVKRKQRVAAFLTHTEFAVAQKLAWCVPETALMSLLSGKEKRAYRARIAKVGTFFHLDHNAAEEKE